VVPGSINLTPDSAGNDKNKCVRAEVDRPSRFAMHRLLPHVGRGFLIALAILFPRLALEGRDPEESSDVA
jgi:hypothetical protein